MHCETFPFVDASFITHVPPTTRYLYTDRRTTSNVSRCRNTGHTVGDFVVYCTQTHQHHTRFNTIPTGAVYHHGSSLDTVGSKLRVFTAVLQQDNMCFFLVFLGFSYFTPLCSNSMQ